MSLYTYIGTDIKLKNEKKNRKQEQYKICDKDDYWFFFLYSKDCKSQHGLNILLNKKFIAEMSDLSWDINNFKYKKEEHKSEVLRQIPNFDDDNFFEIQEKMLKSANIGFQKFFEYLKETLPKNTEAKIYTLYNNKPNFNPTKTVNINLKTFEFPDKFSFEEDVLYILKNS